MAPDRPEGDDEPETSDPDATEAAPAPFGGGDGGQPGATERAAGIPGEPVPPGTGGDLTQPLHDVGTADTAVVPAPTSATVFGAPPVVDPAAAVDQVGQDRAHEELEREALAHKRRRRALITTLVIAILVLLPVAIWLIAAGGADGGDDDETPSTTTSETTGSTTSTTDDDAAPGPTGPVTTAATSSSTTPSTSSTTTPSTPSTTTPTTSSTVVTTTSEPATTTSAAPDTSEPGPSDGQGP
jgi:hypothetical protein